MEKENWENIGVGVYSTDEPVKEIVHGGGIKADSYERTKKIAILIAAAPDLLRACKMIEFQIRDGKILERDACITQIRAAIAKAKGDS